MDGLTRLWSIIAWVGTGSMVRDGLAGEDIDFHSIVNSPRDINTTYAARSPFSTPPRLDSTKSTSRAPGIQKSEV